jgi:hypothetical protein
MQHNQPTTMKTITNEQLNLFVLCAKHYVNNSPKSKLWYAVDKILKGALKQLKKVDERKAEKKRERAIKLEKGVFDLRLDGTFKYDLEGERLLVEDLNAIDQETVEIKTHVITDYDDDPKLISFDMRNAFEGIVIPEIDYDNFDIDGVVNPEKK